MSHICLFVLFLAIAVQISDCENSGINIDCTPSAPGSDKTRLLFIEETAEKIIIKSINDINKIIRRIIRHQDPLAIFSKISLLLLQVIQSFYNAIYKKRVQMLKEMDILGRKECKC